MSTENKPPLIIVGGTFDHTKAAGAFYDKVEEAFGEEFDTQRFLPLWRTRQENEESIEEMISELDARADAVVEAQLARGGVLLDNSAAEAQRPSLLGLSIGGIATFYAISRNPDKYHRAYAVSARANPKGNESLREINRAGATMVEIFARSTHRLDTSRVRTGSPAGGDNRVSLNDAKIPGVFHEEFDGVSQDHLIGVPQIATTPVHVNTIATFLKAA